jgi:hypothetical protein
MNKKILTILMVFLTLNITFAIEGCDSLGLNFESFLAFFASIPEFIMNLILCIQPIFLLLFALAIAGILVLIFKSVLK